MVAVEAMACGAAVVASDRGGLPEACGGAAALVNPEDVDQFARALDSLTDPAALAVAQSAGLVRASTVTWTHTYDALMAALA